MGVCALGVEENIAKACNSLLPSARTFIITIYIFFRVQSEPRLVRLRPEPACINHENCCSAFQPARDDEKRSTAFSSTASPGIGRVRKLRVIVLVSTSKIRVVVTVIVISNMGNNKDFLVPSSLTLRSL